MEYDPAEVERFIEVADLIEDAFPGVMVEGTEVESQDGTFTVSLEDGTVVIASQNGTLTEDDVLSHLAAAGVRPTG